MKPEWNTPVSFLLWTVGVLVLATVARIGWEVGGKVWGLF